MANIFLDTNYLIDQLQKKKISPNLAEHKLYISALSIHISCYVKKIKVPDDTLTEFIKEFNLVDLSKQIVSKALSGPTSDLEDNIQLHSAVTANCDFFLTLDKQLTDLIYFGRLKLASHLT